MEKKLQEKKMLFEVLEQVLSGMEWTVKSWKSNVDDYNNAMKENSEEVRDWEKQQAEHAAGCLDAWEQVKKHLEKLM